MSDFKLAISVYEDHVSPRFDYAQSILIISFDSDSLTQRQSIPTAGMSCMQQMKYIFTEQCTVIVCGAMPGFFHRMAQATGVEVVYASGLIENIIDHVRRGELHAISAPICRGRRGPRNHNRGNHCGSEKHRNGFKNFNGR